MTRSDAFTPLMKPDFTFKGKIFQIEKDALLDSGSDISVIDAQLLNEFSEKPTLIPSDFDNIIAVNNSRTDIQGAVILPLDIGGNVMKMKFHVVKDTNQDIILGKDFIEEFVEAIYVQSKTIVLRNIEGQKEVKEVRMNCVKVQEDVKASAKSCQIKCQAKDRSNLRLCVAKVATHKTMNKVVFPEIAREQVSGSKLKSAHKSIAQKVTAEKPVIHKPLVNKPMIKRAVVKKPVVHKRVIQKSVVHNSVTHKPTNHKTVAQNLFPSSSQALFRVTFDNTPAFRGNIVSRALTTMRATFSANVINTWSDQIRRVILKMYYARNGQRAE